MAPLIDTAKGVYELAKKGMSIELQEKLMILREEALELQEENLKLKKENKELKKKIQLKEELKYRKKVYYRDGDDIPFCPYCFEKSSLLIHLSGPSKVLGSGGQLYTCQECSIAYRTDENGEFKIWFGRRKK